LNASRVTPFRALRYQASRVGDPGSVWAPPYDVIDPELAEEFRAASPHNIVRLTNPEGESPERYESAARLLHSWIAEGVLTQDERPVLYIHRHNFIAGDESYSRTGVWALLRLAGFGEGVVLPHEQTMKGPKADRLALMRACRTQLSPIFFICSDVEGRVSKLILKTAATEATETAEFPKGERHEIWRVAESEDLERLTALLSDQIFLIADGHHRYETALAYREELLAQGPASSGTDSLHCLLAYIVPETDPGLMLLPTHRTIAGEQVDWIGAALRASARFDIVRLEDEDLQRTQELLEQDAGRPAFILVAGGESGGWLMRLRSADAMSVVSSVALHNEFLTECAGLSSQEQLDRIRYVKDSAEALDAVRSGSVQAAALLAASDVSQIRAAVTAGERLPPKTTYFWPKVPTGIAMHSID
jgi:uncharacterized protein (DUF1015 family)